MKEFSEFISGQEKTRDLHFWIGWVLLYPIRLVGCFVHLFIIACICIINCAVPKWFDCLSITPPDFISPYAEERKTFKEINGKNIIDITNGKSR